MRGGGTTEVAGPLAAYLQEHLPRDRGDSPHTVAGYAAASFKLLAVFATERHNLRPCRLQFGHLDIPTLLAFLNHLTDRDNGVRTRKRPLVCDQVLLPPPGMLGSGGTSACAAPEESRSAPLDYLDRETHYCRKDRRDAARASESQLSVLQGPIMTIFPLLFTSQLQIDS